MNVLFRAYLLHNEDLFCLINISILILWFLYNIQMISITRANRKRSVLTSTYFHCWWWTAELKARQSYWAVYHSGFMCKLY